MLLFFQTEAQIVVPKTVNKDYIKRYPNVITVSPYISTSSQQLLVTPSASVHTPIRRNVDYRPNLKGGYGIGLSYRIIDFSIGFRQSLDSVTEALYGKSEASNFSFGVWASRKIHLEFSYKWIKGFSNRSGLTYDTSAIPEGVPFPHRPDLRIRYIKLRSVYQFNPEKFSYRSAFAFSERQLKSKIGYFLNTDLYFHRMRSDSSIVPYTIRDDYGPFLDIRQLRLAGLGVAPGIGGTWTGGKWFLTGVLFVGAEAQYFKYRPENTGAKRQEFRIAPMIDFRYAFGYNSDKWFIGFQGVSDLNLLNSKAYFISSLFNRTLFSVGFRFNTPKVIDRAYDYGVNKLIPEKYRPLLY